MRDDDPKTSEELFTRWKEGEDRQARLHEEYALAFATLAVSGLPMPIDVSTSCGLCVSWRVPSGFVALHYDHIKGRYWWGRGGMDGDETHSGRGDLHGCLIAVMGELGLLTPKG